MAKYIVFDVYRRFYLIWSPIIIVFSYYYYNS